MRAMRSCSKRPTGSRIARTGSRTRRTRSSGSRVARRASPPSLASLVEEGTLELATTARSLLGADLPFVRDDVTVEHLLAHRSGIGDYLDEEAMRDAADAMLPVAVHKLATTEQYLAVLGGFETKFPPGERFSY